jgi:microcystin-dependent protein
MAMSRISTGGGVAAGRITAGVSGITGTTLGSTGGSEGVILNTSQMPVHSHAVSDPGHFHTLPANVYGFTGVSVNNAAGAEIIGISPASGQATAAAATGITIGNAGSGSIHANVQPSIIVNKIIYMAV